MPSSLIIVALAVAWLVVLVPMVARKRQAIARTGDDALASRIVRSGGLRGDEREESVMVESAEDPDLVEDEAELEEPELPSAVEEDDAAEVDAEPMGRGAGRYRPGRGGFDPEAAEIAAQAKYAFRQRVVVSLLATVLITAVLAGFLFTLLWWATGGAFTVLVGYLAYLRRQVRIENEIRERRLARLAGARSSARRRRREDEYDVEYERDAEDEYMRVEEEPMTLAGVERKPHPRARLPRRNAIVVDLDDEDPAFYELDEPGRPVYRRAVGE